MTSVDTTTGPDKGEVKFNPFVDLAPAQMDETPPTERTRRMHPIIVFVIVGFVVVFGIGLIAQLMGAKGGDHDPRSSTGRGADSKGSIGGEWD